MAADLSVIIAGAGIGGLTAGIALAKSGAIVTVLEKAARISEVGAGIQQSPNAMAVHAALGTASDIIAAGFAPSAGTIRDYKTGSVKLRTEMRNAYAARYGHPYIHIHRADLIEILRAHAVQAGVDIKTGQTVVSCENIGSGVCAQTLTDNFSADILIGSDGINSVVAKQLHGETPARFTGQMAWRGLVKASDIPAGLIPKEAAVWAGPDAHFVSYYVRGGDLINFVAVKERAEWTEESWSKPGDIIALRDTFAGWDAPVTTLLTACNACYEWGLFDRPELKSWSAGRIVLLGDAAHPMLPFMAQGAAMAIEDAWALAQSIMKNSNTHSAFFDYEKLRKPRATKLQNISKENAAMFHAPGVAAIARDAKLTAARVLPFAQKLRFDPIYGYDVTKEI